MRLMVLISAVTFVAVDAHAVPVPVTTCGQVVTARSAELVQDLDCSAFAGNAIVMDNGGRLALNGFTLLADAGGVGNGVVCTRRCKVSGPGTISGGGVAAFLYGTFGSITVDGVSIDGAEVGVWGQRAIVRNSTLTGNDVGVVGYTPPFGSALLRNSTVTGSGSRGVLGVRIRIIDSQVTGNGGACPPMEVCCDLAALNTVAVRGTSVCGSSCRYDGSGTFGVCSND